jgi:hypothetical protein
MSNDAFSESQEVLNAGMWAGLVYEPPPPQRKLRKAAQPPEARKTTKEASPFKERMRAVRRTKVFKEFRESVTATGLPDPYLAFLLHKGGAASRGLAFSLTFEQWWWLWEPHYANRGNKPHQMCMSRFHDCGGYEMGNVRIATNAINARERVECAAEAALKRSAQAQEALDRIKRGGPKPDYVDRAIKKWLTAPFEA